jgi:amino acid transporter
MTRDQASGPGLDSSGVSAFTSFAISLSTICIVAGGITSFHVGLCSVGGASIGLGWPLCCLFALIVALTMGQLASAFPHAGGPYQWAAILGGRAWGWVTACFGLAGLVTVLAAINVGTCRFGILTVVRQLGLEPGDIPPAAPALTVVLMTASQALVNHLGIRFTSRLVDFSGYLILVVAVVLTVTMLVFGGASGFDLGRLVTFTNYSGEAGNTWPATADLVWLFALGLLLPAYTVTGFDAPAQTAEETVDPHRNVPRGIVRSVLVSGVAGWIMLAAIVLAAPDLGVCASKGDEGVLWIVGEVAPQPLQTMLYVGLIAAMYLCGLATLTSASRLTYAFARDGGLPLSRALRRIGKHQTPFVAIWTSAAAATLFAVCIAYETIAAVCAGFLYIAYVLPIALGLVAYDRTWTRMGPWHIGGWYRPLAVVSVLGCVGLIIIGMQPPNEIAGWIVGTMVLGLVALWFGWMSRHFPGPPPEVLLQLRELDTPAKQRSTLAATHPVGQP